MEYAFDVVMRTVVRVTVPDEKDESHARKVLSDNETVDIASVPVLDYEHGIEVFVTEASFDLGTLHLFEVNGEAVGSA